MITVDRIIIKEFRGIRELDLIMEGKSFAISGPNGTGKSGIVDALEFVLTGTISRLTGRGRGDLSIRDHAPHVDSKANPEKAIVEAYLSIPSLKLKGPIHVTRSVKNPKVLMCSPDTPQIRAVLARVASHPEIALSRREIIRYILAEPAKRAEDVQELLRLEALRTIRATLQKIANACERDAEATTGVATKAGQDLSQTLSLPLLNSDTLLTAVNTHRKTLSLEPLQALAATTSIRDGLTATGGVAQSLVPKKQATEDVKACSEEFIALSAIPAQQERENAVAALTALKADEGLLDGVKRTQLLDLALELYDEERCSVCDTEFEPDAFREIVGKKVEKLKAIAQERKKTELIMGPIVVRLRSLAQAITKTVTYGPKLKPAVSTAVLQDLAKQLNTTAFTLERMLPLDGTLEALKSSDKLPLEAQEVLTALGNAISLLPEPTSQQQAFDALTIGQGRLQSYRDARLAAAGAKKRADIARKVFDTFSQSSESELEGIYKKVEADYSKYYRMLNDDDESTFAAQLTPSMGKLGFGVDFYKRGFFPPGAYHSEGHQDSMGLCLYLALMKHLQGNGFTFAVLDDVLMSVDSGHRRQVCKLLKTDFPNTQFVLTTHDRVWLKHMISAGLVAGKSCIQFRKWSVEEGPSSWATGDIWTEISDHLANNDVKSASGALRHYVEHLGGEVCQALRASVEYRGDGQHNPAELLDPAISEFRSLLKRAKVAAKSWGNTAQHDAIEALEKEYAAAVSATKLDQWQINAAIHFNPWANLEKKDFEAIVAGFSDLVSKLTCSKCHDLIEVRPERGARETLHCSCGANNYTLESKSGKVTAE